MYFKDPLCVFRKQNTKVLRIVAVYIYGRTRAYTASAARKGVETRMQLSTAIVYNYYYYYRNRVSGSLFGTEGPERESTATHFPFMLLLYIITRAILYSNPLSSLIIGSTPPPPSCRLCFDDFAAQCSINILYT